MPGTPSPHAIMQSRHAALRSTAQPRTSWAALHRSTSPRSRRRRLACHAQAVQVAVVGGGAAGLTAAYFAAAERAEVVVLEKNSECGRKILISGGTRCNVLPLAADPQRDYFSESSQSALRAVFSSWSVEECQEWLSSPRHIGLQLALEEETLKYFPVSNSAQEVRDRLVAACQRRGVAVRQGAGLAGLRRREGGGWACQLEGGGEVVADRVVLATGGKSFPKLGTTGVGYQLAAQLGHALHPPYPALTPLLGRHPGGEQLAGVSLYSSELSCLPASPAAAAAAAAGRLQQQGNGNGAAGAVAAGAQQQVKGKAGKAPGRQRRAKPVKAQRSAMLFTHRGYSGPAILDLSHYVIKDLERGEPVPELVVDWTGEGRAAWEQRLSGGGPGGAANLLRKHGIPQRLAEALCAEAGMPLDRRLSELKKGEREALLVALARFPLPVTGHEGYAKAEVTGGGIPLNEVDCTSMESRLAPGLHLCGEVLDVFGRIGGFNFYWAWLTGRLAGMAAARMAKQGEGVVAQQKS